jgi:hypothetical protein
MKKIILLAVLISFTQCSKKTDASKITKITPKKYSGVILTNDTAVRIDPYIFSARVDLLKKGESVEITDKSSEKSAVGSTVDFWFKVSTSKKISGWIYGKNIHILENDKSSVDSFVNKFWEKEKETVRKHIIGRWWSINKFGDFTNHVLEINDGKTYRSYPKGGETSAIEGEYSLDFTNNEILFAKGTSFEKNLSMVLRGDSLILYRDTEKGEILFKKIKLGSAVAEEKKAEEKKEQEEKEKNAKTK